ncbi:MAG: TIGR03086 family metal-binding protein [Acidimicrobiales bacterium]
MDVAKLHERAVNEFIARVEAVGGRWRVPTPCPKWDVRALVNHVVAEDLWTPPLMAGGTVDEAGDRLEGDVLGDDPVAAARAAAGAAVAATSEALAAGRTVHLSFGDTTAEEYAYQLAADHVIHGWDLAVATGGDAEMDPDLVEALAVWFADREELYRAAGVIGDRPEGDDPSEPQDLLLSAFGRRSTWSC